ncbi:acetate kinase [Salipiger sp. HF18]|uniref:acetate/propionate family kinase n=1 Tax=Salipiger sp. HF18 TaxID=2721557 RepID=UPI00142D5205|nr:acetate kinase [Salipiger sp. HF18]NIY97264.1 acetate kinase [Salipiger sp. HF18]
MTGAVLALNAGSSSFKFALANAGAPGTPLLWGVVDRLGTEEGALSLKGQGGAATTPLAAPDHGAALAALIEAIETRCPGLRVTAVAHRIVHGGSAFTAPEPVTPALLEALEALVPLAPLHQPHGLRGIRTALELFPDAGHVACFDTAFHAGRPWVHDAYALPRRFYDEGIRRYGFHGLACASICRALGADGYPLAERRIAIAHLGNGCSVTAVRHGRSVSNSMGFSALEGLAMGTRCGRLDPGVLLHLMRGGMDVTALEALLYRKSGLLGLSGLSNDMRDLARSGSVAAEEAIAYFIERTVEEICRAAGVMGGLDAVVFSGGIGENAADIRAAVMARLAFLPGAEGAGLEMLVRPADEEAELLRTAAGLRAAEQGHPAAR